MDDMLNTASTDNQVQPSAPQDTEISHEDNETAKNTESLNHSDNTQGYSAVSQNSDTQIPAYVQNAPSQGYIPPQINAFPPEKKVKKPKTSVGKLVFISLICISIALTSVALGIAFTRPDVAVDDTTSSEEETKKDIVPVSVNGADPNLQESPLIFKDYTGEGSMTADQVYAAVKDVNVGILVYYNGQMIGEGSGIIVGEDSTGTYTYIITAAHVISDSGIDVQIQFSDESEIEGAIIGFDKKTDVGVVRVKRTGLKAAVFGNSDNLVVGQTVYAIGNPGGTEFFGSFTSGLVSAIDRPVPTTSSSYDLPCIQHNAAINPGNSGGALVNEFGQVIGLNSSKISSTEYEGMGFAVPSNTMLEIYQEIIANGYVSDRPMLGITYAPVSSDQTYSAIAWQNNLPYGSVVIASISESSDLNNHDVEVGDIITAVNGEDLKSTDILLEIIENATVGTEIELTICRLSNKGEVEKEFDITVKLVEDIGDNVVIEPEEQSNSLEDYIYGY